MIIGGWIWRLLKTKLVEPYEPSQVKNASYDVHLGDHIIIYRWMGHDLPGARGKLLLVDGEPKVRVLDDLYPALFAPGDLFLGETVEYFKQPVGFSLQFMLKSSQARNFLEHLHAGFGEAGFHGKYTLEFQPLRMGFLYPYSPVGQMIPHLTLGLGSYERQADARYRDQKIVTPSKNSQLAFRPIDEGQLESLQYVGESIKEFMHGLP